MPINDEDARLLIDAALDDAKRWVKDNKESAATEQDHMLYIVDPLEFDGNLTHEHYYGLVVAFVSKDASDVRQASEQIHATFGQTR